MSVREEIIRVFKRSVVAHPEGAIVHMGDCNIYNIALGVCTCGLSHWLIQDKQGTIEELYPNFLEEENNEGLIAYLLEEFKDDNLYVKKDGKFIKVEKSEPISAEKFNRILDETFRKEDGEGKEEDEE